MPALRWLVFAILAVFLGCDTLSEGGRGPNPDPTPGGDAGVVGTPADAGLPGGPGPTDSGHPAVDSGTPASDAGTSYDAGSPFRTVTVTVEVSGGSTPISGAYVNLDAQHRATTNAQGEAQLMNVPLAAASFNVTAPYCATSTASLGASGTAVVVQMSCGAATPGGDQLDLSSATILNSPPDVPGWAVTTQLVTLDLGSASGPAGQDGAFVNFSKRDGTDGVARWPDIPFGTGSLEYTLWMVLNIGGQWYTSGGIQFWYDPSDVLRNGGPPEGYTMNWYYDPGRWAPMTGDQPQPGELVGFFVTAGNERNVSDHSGTMVLERSNVVLVPFPDANGAVFTYGSLPPPCGILASGAGLPDGQGVTSCDGRFQLLMQGDGNLVLYEGSTVLWASNTPNNPGATASMQGDGNFVVYLNGNPLWASNTAGNAGASLTVQNDGNTVVSLNGTVLWSTNTGGH